MNGNLFLLEEAESVRRMPRDRQKLTESIIYAYARVTLRLHHWRSYRPYTRARHTTDGRVGGSVRLPSGPWPP